VEVEVAVALTALEKNIVIVPDTALIQDIAIILEKAVVVVTLTVLPLLPTLFRIRSTVQ
jgi:hypothetical protein